MALLPELTDDATLTSNLLNRPLHGRRDIVKFITSVSDRCASVADIERLNTPSYLVTESRATLKTGHRIEVTAVGTLDDLAEAVESAIS